MACTECKETNPIKLCGSKVILGSISASTSVYIFVKNLSTGYIHRQEALSANDGTLSLDLSFPDQSFYSPNFIYEMSVILKTDHTNSPIEVNIGYQTYTCLLIGFEKVFDENDENVSYSSETITLK